MRIIIIQDVGKHDNYIFIGLFIIFLDHRWYVVFLYCQNLFRVIFDLIVLVILVKEKIGGLCEDVGTGNDIELGVEITAFCLCDDLDVDKTAQYKDKDEA